VRKAEIGDSGALKGEFGGEKTGSGNG